MAPYHELPFVYTPRTVLLANAPDLALAVPGRSAASTGAQRTRWVWPATEPWSSVRSRKKRRGEGA